MDIEIDQIQRNGVDQIQSLGSICRARYLTTGDFQDAREGMAQTILMSGTEISMGY